MLAGSFLYMQNNLIKVNTMLYKNPKIPETFRGFSIVQISDLHDKSFGKGQSRLVKKIRGLSPDIIVVTGDIIDKRKNSMAGALSFMEQAVKIAPVYFVSGNHEENFAWRIPMYAGFSDLGVKILLNEKTVLEKNGRTINLWGLRNLDGYIPCLKKIAGEKDALNIVLSHRPDRFGIYEKSGADLVFTGHAHGGLIRLFGRGLFAPNQGFFPKYTSDAYVRGGTTMVVSRGLGHALFPQRFMNRPEIVEVVLG